MSEGVIVALITLCGSGIGSLCGIIISNKLTTYRIGELEKKVDKHNTVIERTFVLEGDVKLLNQEINDLKERAN
jgi:hypothetical protein